MTRKDSPWGRALAVPRVGTPAGEDIGASSAFTVAARHAAAPDPELASLTHRVTRLERLLAQGSPSEPAPADPIRRSEGA